VVGEHAFVHVACPALARAALAGAARKAPLYAAFKGFVGEGLFTAEGATWRVPPARATSHTHLRVRALRPDAPCADATRKSAGDTCHSRRRGKRVAVARALAAPGASAALDAAANAEMGTLLARLAARINAADGTGGSGSSGGATQAGPSATVVTAGAAAHVLQAAPFADVDMLPELQRMALRAMFRFLTVRTPLLHRR
jgi:hypothetical protein